MEKPLNILLVDDDEDQYILLKELFSSSQADRHFMPFDIQWVGTYEQALKALPDASYDVFLIDYRLGMYDGLDLLRAAARIGCQAPIIMLTGQGDYEVDRAAMELGAADYLLKDQLSLLLLERSIRYALEQKRAQNELEALVKDRTRDLARTNEELIAEINLRRQVETVLRESEIRFRGLTETTSAAILILQDQQIVYANPASRFVFGYLPEELVHKEFTEIIHPTYREILKLGATNDGRTVGIIPRYELKIVKKNGDERWVDVTTGQIEYKGLPGLIVTAFDITERDMAEKALRQANERLEAEVKERTGLLIQRAEELDRLQAATSALLETMDLETLLTQILQSTRLVIPAAQESWLYLAERILQPLNERLSPAFFDSRILQLEASKDFHNFDRYDTGKPVVMNDTRAGRVGLPLGDVIEDPAEIRSAMSMPLRLEAELLGALTVSAARPFAFSDADQRVLATFATTATLAIHNVIMHHLEHKRAITDSLTGQLNRREFAELGQREIERFHRYGHKLSLILFDIDHLKAINDTYGHPVGDQVIRVVAERCHTILRQVDILGRLGGDEFGILMPEVESLNEKGIAERIRRIVATAPVQTDAGPLEISISLGISRVSEGIADLNGLMTLADQALYKAKNSGRNQIKVSRPLQTKNSPRTNRAIKK